jgi:hypothetical protein
MRTRLPGSAVPEDLLAGAIATAETTEEDPTGDTETLESRMLRAKYLYSRIH